MTDSTGRRMRLTILSPVYDDWVCARHLLTELSDLAADLAPLVNEVRVVLIDDGSPRRCPDDLAADVDPAQVAAVDVVRLARNVGHQRAIAIGLCYASERVPCDLLLVMDCDGEDQVSDVPKLVDAAVSAGMKRVVFAARARRSEGVVFRVGYITYRWLHRLLTGVPVRFGNFSVMPSSILHSLPLVSETWNHYAAAVIKARIPFSMVALNRGRRFAGTSTMNVVSLTMHGVSALSVFAEVISVRLLIITLLISGLAVLALASSIVFSPGSWLVISSIAATAMMFVSALVISAFMLGIHAVRGAASFLPKRDYHLFVQTATSLRLGEADAAKASLSVAASVS